MRPTPGKVAPRLNYFPIFAIRQNQSANRRTVATEQWHKWRSRRNGANVAQYAFYGGSGVLTDERPKSTLKNGALN